MSPKFNQDGTRVAKNVNPPGEDVSGFAIYDTTTGKQTESITYPCGSICYSYLSPDLSLLLTLDPAQEDAQLQVWDIATGEQINSLPLPAERMTQFGFTPDGRTLLGLSEEGVLFAWDADDWKQAGSHDL